MKHLANIYIKKHLHLGMKIIFIIIINITICACKSSINDVKTVSYVNSDITVYNESDIGKEREVKLSELVEGFRIVRLDNRDEAIFKWNWIFFSENYFCVKQYEGEAKLFDINGKFIANVGKKGQGPGEYSTVYDILINEDEGAIYISPFSGDELMKYDLNGEFIEKIDLGARLNKPRLSKTSKSTLSLVQLCFKDRGDLFTAANIDINSPDSIEHIYSDALAMNMKNREGASVGFNAEIWSYRNNNSQDFSFMMTHSDTIYHYNSRENRIKPDFTINLKESREKESFLILNELPNHYLAFVVGEDRDILVDKRTKKAYECSIVNDFLEDMNTSVCFQDGYYFACYEPAQLKEKIQEHIKSGDCDKSQIAKLEELKGSLKENDNNILFIAKLKQ